MLLTKYAHIKTAILSVIVQTNTLLIYVLVRIFVFHCDDYHEYCPLAYCSSLI